MVRMSEWEQTVSLELWFEEKKNAGCLTVKQCSILGFKFRGENYFQSVFVLVSMTLLRCENPKAVCGPWKVRERTEYCPLHLLPSFDSHAADMVTHRQVGLWIILLPTHDCPFLSLSLFVAVHLLFLPTVILEKPIRIPRSLSVKAASVLKGFLNKVRVVHSQSSLASPSPVQSAVLVAQISTRGVMASSSGCAADSNSALVPVLVVVHGGSVQEPAPHFVLPAVTQCVSRVTEKRFGIWYLWFETK